MSKRVLRYIHVGVGNRGSWPCKWATREHGYEPVALCDINVDSLALARKQTGLTADACFDSLHDAIASVDADCCIICTPTSTHVPLAIQAINAGLPVLMEKAMSTNWNDALTLQAHARKTNTPVCVSHNSRYQPHHLTTHAAITQPDHPAHPGELFMMNYTHHRVRPHPDALTFPFAAVWDLSCHHFDTMLHWFGPAHSISGHNFSAPWSAYPHPNNVALHLRFANGVQVQYLHTVDASRSEWSYVLHGRRGTLLSNDQGLSFNLRPAEQYGNRPIQPVTLLDSHDPIGVLADFHDYVTRGVEPGISVHQILEVMAMCQMTTLACCEHRVVYRSELQPPVTCDNQP